MSEPSFTDTEPKWLDREMLDAIHEQVLAETGGNHGINDAGMIDSALGKAQNQFYYGGTDNLSDLAATYTEGIAHNHGYTDGNKRTGFLAAETFLNQNGYQLDPVYSQEFIDTIENVVDNNHPATRENLVGVYKKATLPLEPKAPVIDTKMKASAPDAPNSAMKKVASAFGNLSKNSGVAVSAVLSLGVGAATLLSGESVAKAAEATVETGVPYAEPLIDVVQGDVDAAHKSATIETAATLGSLGGAAGGAALGTMIAPGPGTIAGGVIGAFGGGMGVGIATDYVMDNSTRIIDGVADFFDSGDDKLFERLPTEIDSTAPPELQHLAEIKKMHVQAKKGNAEPEKLEEIENMYDKAYDEYDNAGLLNDAMDYLDQLEQKSLGTAVQKTETTLSTDQSVTKTTNNFSI